MSNPVDLRELAGDRFKIALDESAVADPTRSERPWLYRIPCRYGFIGVHGADTLLVYCGAARVIPRLLAIPGVIPRQIGDGEVNATFLPDRLDEVADVLQARRRRRLGDEHRQQLAAIGQGSRFGRRTERDILRRSDSPALAR
jgi:hypothetical protein